MKNEHGGMFGSSHDPADAPLYGTEQKQTKNVIQICLSMRENLHKAKSNAKRVFAPVVSHQLKYPPKIQPSEH